MRTQQVGQQAVPLPRNNAPQPSQPLMQIPLPVKSAQNRPPAQNVTLAQIHNANLQTISNPTVAQNSNQNPNHARNSVPVPNSTQNQTLVSYNNQNVNPVRNSAPIPNPVATPAVAQTTASGSNPAPNLLAGPVSSANNLNVNLAQSTQSSVPALPTR